MYIIPQINGNNQKITKVSISLRIVSKTPFEYFDEKAFLSFIKIVIKTNAGVVMVRFRIKPSCTKQETIEYSMCRTILFNLLDFNKITNGAKNNM